jgi:hypothetical protein
VFAALALLLLASACSGGDGEATRTVTVTKATTVTVTETATGVPPSGVLPVEAFNARAESVDKPWESDLEKITEEFLALRPQENSARSFQSTSSGDSGSATLVIDGLGDDSVRARRYELTFARRDDGTWKVESAHWAQRCHEGRGHQDFSPESCL